MILYKEDKNPATFVHFSMQLNHNQQQSYCDILSLITCTLADFRAISVIQTAKLNIVDVMFVNTRRKVRASDTWFALLCNMISWIVHKRDIKKRMAAEQPSVRRSYYR